MVVGVGRTNRLEIGVYTLGRVREIPDQSAGRVEDPQALPCHRTIIARSVGLPPKSGYLVNRGRRVVAGLWSDQGKSHEERRHADIGFDGDAAAM